MEQVEKTALANELSDHIEERLLLKVNTDSHVQHDIGVPQLVEHLDLLDEVFHCLPRHVSFAELLDCDFGAHPLGFEHVAVATSTDWIGVWIHLQLFEINEEVKAVLTEGQEQARVLS